MESRSESEKNLIDLDLPEFSKTTRGCPDDTNILVIPSKKSKVKLVKKKNLPNKTKILSKKQRKNLEKVLEKSRKKKQRSAILEALSNVQISQNELKNYASISQVQTYGLKKLKKNISNQDFQLKRKISKKVEGMQKKSKMRKLSFKEKEEIIGNKMTTGLIIPRDIDDYEDLFDNSSKEEQPHNELMPLVKVKQEEERICQEAKAILSKPAVYVHVDRDVKIQNARLKLPILAEEQHIMETINDNDVVIIVGETGSGKTTQIPQFLYEAGYAENKMIGITEPRRVAAISMSKRVAMELNLTEKEVSYLIRFEGNVTDNTKIKFMTDGVLLKEVEVDFLLTKYSVIILDEAHERTTYTDILIGLLSRIVKVRKRKHNPLKLIIMSATLKIEDFTNNQKLFEKSPPVINIETRQFPVTIHFQKKTASDYVKEAYRKVIKIHTNLPEGGILVFLTGQLEVKYLCQKLKETFPFKSIDEIEKKNIKPREAKAKKTELWDLPKIQLDGYSLPSEEITSSLFEHSNDKNFSDELSETKITHNTQNPLWVLPLYSLLPSEKQNKVFEEPPDGCRLCVVSTNLAETSITIPKIKYVIDSGRQKTRIFDKVTGVSSFVVTFTTKASANQRAGRSGRQGPGHCYRLYSSAVYNTEFNEFALPDIQNKPVEELVLQMKFIGIDKVMNFPFPSPPNLTQIEVAENHLIMLGALENQLSNGESISKLTALGQAIVSLPVAPCYAKMLVLSHQKNLLPYVICIVAGFSVRELLLDNKQNKWQEKYKQWIGTGNSLLLGDAMVILKTIGAAEYAGSQGKLHEFCVKNGIREKAVIEARKLRIQLTNMLNYFLLNSNLYVDPLMQPPSDNEAKYIRQILVSGLGDRVARKIKVEHILDKNEKKKMKYAYECGQIESPVYIHYNSVLRKTLPEWAVYQEIFEIENDEGRKTFMRDITAIEPEWLLIYVPQACNIMNIKEDPIPKYNSSDGKIYCYVEATFGKQGWQLPISEIEMPFSEKACRYFGMFLLNGEVFPVLKTFKKNLKITPSSIIKNWSNLNENVANFIKRLFSQKVFNKTKLESIWSMQNNYLLDEYEKLLYGIDQSKLIAIWPPINKPE